MRAAPILAFLAALLAASSALAAGRPELSCSWRVPAPDGSADDPTGDPGAPWTPGQRLTDAAWRALDEHFQQHHFGLWTAAEVAALEATPGVAMAVLQPLPDVVGEDGRLYRPDEAGVVQWPGSIAPSDVILVAIGNARPGEDWVLRPIVAGEGGSLPRPLAGPATAPSDPVATGFYRVHRLVADAERWRDLSFEVHRLDLDPFELEAGLALTTGSVTLDVSHTTADSPQVLASGSFSVRSRTLEALDAPAVVNLSLQGPGSELFTLEVLPAGGEPAASADRNVRVTDRLDFLVLAPPSTLSGSAFIDQLLPPGQALALEVVAEIVSFAGPPGQELDMGLSSLGFSVAPGTAVIFPPASLLPAGLVRHSAYLEVWRRPPSQVDPEDR